MINGDIDLTENLDFYHDKKDKKNDKGTSIIPWNAITSPTINRYDIDPYTSQTSNSTINYINSYTSQSTNSTITNFSWNRYDDPVYMRYEYLSSNVLTLSYNQLDQDFYTYNTFYDCLNLNYTDYSKCKSFIIDSLGSYFDDSEKESSIFGKYRHHEMKGIKISKLFKKKREDASKNDTVKLFRERDRHEYSKDLTYLNSMLASFRIKASINGSKHEIIDNSRGRRRPRLMHIDDEYSESKKRLHEIPWLKKLIGWRFDDYVEELRNGEKDYSKYLTDMNWLRMN